MQGHQPFLVLWLWGKLGNDIYFKCFTTLINCWENQWIILLDEQFGKWICLGRYPVGWNIKSRKMNLSSLRWNIYGTNSKANNYSFIVNCDYNDESQFNFAKGLIGSRNFARKLQLSCSFPSFHQRALRNFAWKLQLSCSFPSCHKRVFRNFFRKLLLNCSVPSCHQRAYRNLAWKIQGDCNLFFTYS